MLIVIDNYDSFTYNLVQYFGELGVPVRVYRNDQVSIEQLQADAPRYLVISPGPCTPNEAGISMDAIRAFAGQVPILGVCLGHQSIGQVYGGRVVRAEHVMHGKTSQIFHSGGGMMRGLPSPFQATRYHSLIVAWPDLPDCLEVTAWTQKEDGSPHEIMGLRHKELAVQGVQFHPESLFTKHGRDLLRNFLEQ